MATITLYAGKICGGLQVRIIRIEKENFEHQQKLRIEKLIHLRNSAVKARSLYRK